MVSAALSDAGCARCIPTMQWKNHAHRKLSTRRANPSKVVGVDKQNWFEEGLEAEAILGVKDSQQGIFFLVKWKGKEDLDLIPALTTVTHVPSLVLTFYANRISWVMQG